MSPLPDEVCRGLAEQPPLAVFRNIFSAIRPDPSVPTDTPYYDAVSLQRDILFGFWKGALLRYAETRDGEASMEYPIEYPGKIDHEKPSAYLTIKKHDEHFFTYTLHLDDEDGESKLQFYYNPREGYIFLPDKVEPNISYWAKHRGSGENYEFTFSRNDLKRAKQTIEIPSTHAYKNTVVTTEVQIPYFNIHRREEGESYM